MKKVTILLVMLLITGISIVVAKISYKKAEVTEEIKGSPVVIVNHNELTSWD